MSNIYAVGDIHGCFKTFRKLIEDRIYLAKDDELIILGDVINRGPSSRKPLNHCYLPKRKVFSYKWGIKQDLMNLCE